MLGSGRRFHLDGHVGRVKQAFEAAGVWNNTFIVWTSDNGGCASERSFLLYLPMLLCSCLISKRCT